MRQKSEAASIDLHERQNVHHRERGGTAVIAAGT
jgi:hypothetical protein